MNQHVGASFTLSVLVVVFFAVILYEPDHARPVSPPGSTSEPVEATQAPPPTPGVPLIESAATAEPPASSITTRPLEAVALIEPERIAPPKLTTPPSRPRPRVAPPAQPPAASDPPAVIQVVSRRQSPPPGRHSAFTQVGEGESLTDVALRVYGTSEASTALWRANRDIIAHRETPLNPGLLLRTP
ncbi:hypothetical protein SAMN05444166_0198 [Singulisphaera sp. GP187]|nr:hypothetical protein SAMN05444166_0198 [Singulisphaera sp. GP187]